MSKKCCYNWREVNIFPKERVDEGSELASGETSNKKTGVWLAQIIMKKIIVVSLVDGVEKTIQQFNWTRDELYCSCLLKRRQCRCAIEFYVVYKVVDSEVIEI